MPVPVSELISRHILTTVATVTVANGYSYNLTVQRHAKSGDKRTHLNTIIVQDDPREGTDGQVYNTREWVLPFVVGCYIVPLETDTTPIDTYVNIIAADIEKALMVDRYRGGNAMDTTIRASHTISEGLEYDCIVVNVEVSYRTSELDPYVNAK